MSTTIEVRKGPWIHNNERLPYQVIGNASVLSSPYDFIGRPEMVGTALSVEGYEQTGKVSGFQVQVYEERRDGSGPILRYLKMGEFDAPRSIVVYGQLAEGKQYHKDQLWWRPAENFAQNFTPLPLNQG